MTYSVNANACNIYIFVTDLQMALIIGGAALGEMFVPIIEGQVRPHQLNNIIIYTRSGDIFGPIISMIQLVQFSCRLLYTRLRSSFTHKKKTNSVLVRHSSFTEDLSAERSTFVNFLKLIVQIFLI